MADDDVPRRLRGMMRDVELAIAEQVDPALLFEIEEALGTIPEPRHGVPLHGLQQIAAMGQLVEESIQDSVEAIQRQRALHDEIVGAVMHDARVIDAMEEATRRGDTNGAVPVAMAVMREELTRRRLPESRR